jgi:hypothetical protein
VIPQLNAVVVVLRNASVPAPGAAQTRAHGDAGRSAGDYRDFLRHVVRAVGR